MIATEAIRRAEKDCEFGQMSTNGFYVLIPTHGRAPLLERTLASLAECALPEGYVETVVVENGSKEGAEAICQQADARLKVRYLHVEKANKSHALNEALKLLPAEALVVYLDDDVRLEPGVLTAYARAAEGRTGGQFYGGPTAVDYEADLRTGSVSYLPPSRSGWTLERGREPDFLGFNWAAFVGDVRERRRLRCPARAGDDEFRTGVRHAVAPAGERRRTGLRRRGHGLALRATETLFARVDAAACHSASASAWAGKSGTRKAGDGNWQAARQAMAPARAERAPRPQRRRGHALRRKLRPPPSPVDLAAAMSPDNSTLHGRRTVSVVIPCYNAASHVEAAVASVLAQTTALESPLRRRWFDRRHAWRAAAVGSSIRRSSG